MRAKPAVSSVPTEAANNASAADGGCRQPTATTTVPAARPVSAATDSKKTTAQIKLAFEKRGEVMPNEHCPWGGLRAGFISG